MNKKYILFFLFGLLSITISAQSLAEAKALYEKGEYEEAKPAFKKFVKTQLKSEIREDLSLTKEKVSNMLMKLLDVKLVRLVRNN